MSSNTDRHKDTHAAPHVHIAWCKVVYFYCCPSDDFISLSVILGVRAAGDVCYAYK